MNQRYEEFLNSIENKGTVASLKSYSYLADYDYTDATEEFLLDVMKSNSPKTARVLYTIKYVLKRYLTYIGETGAAETLAGISASRIIDSVLHEMPKRYFSENDFNDLQDFIELTQELNVLFTQTLLRACYEGIYSDDMSVLINLRASDINGNILTLRNSNGYVYKFEVSHQLAADLKELSEINVFQRYHKSGRYSNLPISGVHPDSCFKYNNRGEDPNDFDRYRNSYWRVIRNIGKAYGRKITPQILFVSGVLCRLKNIGKEYGLSIKEMFEDANPNSLGMNLVKRELMRCNYAVEIATFRYTVMSFAEQIDEG